MTVRDRKLRRIVASGSLTSLKARRNDAQLREMLELPRPAM
jgi:hypothetical protein